MKWISICLIGLSGIACAMTCEESLARLREGNDRYVHDALEHPNRTSERREAIVAKQTPFAVIIACSDSRVPPEIVFDQGVGDLFVVRVAGNVIGQIELESIEYGVAVLHASCVVILGHESCGAVKAVVDGQAQSIASIAKLIAPAVKEAKQSDPEHLLTTSIKDNALRMRDFLLQSKLIKKFVQQKKVNAHAAYYDLNTGAVEWLCAKNH